MAWIALGLVAAAVIAFYSWTVSPDGGIWRHWTGRGGYYASLVEGFQVGRLHMAIEPSAALRALRDPYDPAQNAPYRLHDASYYQGHYYLYFGVTPVFLFFWPLAALTGHAVSDELGVLCFCVAGYLASIALLIGIRRRYFPRSGWGSMLAGTVALGLMTMVPTLLRRPAVYEVPIAAAYASGTIALGALWQAMHSLRVRVWTACASLAFGAAAGARPLVACGAIILVLPLWQRWRTRRQGSPAPGVGGLALAAGLPFAAIALGLMLYNHARFGRFLEFGQNYQLSGAREGALGHFSFRYLWFNVRAYLLSPTRLSAYFPYVIGIHPPVRPAGQFGLEDPYGLLPNLPFVALAALAVYVVKGKGTLGLWCAAVLAVGLLNLGPILLFGGACSRYMVDFLPALVLLAAVAVLGLEAAPSVAVRIWGRVLWIPLFLTSALFAVLASINHNALLQTEHPDVYHSLAHLGNYPSRWIDRLEGERYGPLEVTLKFPAHPSGPLEPLLVNGDGARADFLYVNYPDARHVVFGFEHTGYGGPVTEQVELDFTRPHTLQLDLGALYPPRSDPFFDRWKPDQVQARLGRIRLCLDGQWLMDDPAECFDPLTREPSLGESSENPALGRRFSGVIMEQHRIGELVPDPFGALRLLIELPRSRTGVSEPLLATGSSARGDVVRIVYVDDRHVRFVHDHGGQETAVSPDIPVEYAGRHRLEISMGSLYPDGSAAARVPPSQLAWARARLLVRWDGAIVLDVADRTYGAGSGTVTVGGNGVADGRVEARFSGKILESLRGWKL